jgi:hypothetical protein
MWGKGVRYVAITHAIEICLLMVKWKQGNVLCA